MSYAPGTIFRIYTSDKTYHFTVVLLKNGKILEVKNMSVAKKQTFPSLTMWRTFHSATEEEVQVDTSKCSGTVIMDSIADGFNYPKENHTAYKWIQWCYSIVKEAAPHLLNSEEFKLAYNNMVDICNQYKNDLSHIYSTRRDINYYSPDNIKYNNANKDKYYNIMCGYPGFIYNP